MDDTVLTNTAVGAAINHEWKLAIKLNLQLVKQNPKDIEAFNRLGRAYLETGQKTKAVTSYRQVLKTDRFNPIAIRGLDQAKSRTIHLSPSPRSDSPLPMFLEEPGVTKILNLARLGDPKTLSTLRPGDRVFIVAREYLGRLPDDLASRMRIFLKSGNTYSAWIKSLDLHSIHSSQTSLKIFIKETHRSTKFATTPSFPVTEKLTYAAFTPPELVHEEKPDTAGTGEESPESEPQARVDTEFEAMP